MCTQSYVLGIPWLHRQHIAGLRTLLRCHAWQHPAVDALDKSVRNVQAPPKSLLEQHQEQSKQQKPGKRKRDAQDPPASASQKQLNEKGQAWVPFDREKDMQEVSASKSRYAALLQGESSLGSRFQSGK